jgi:hypothetical protein
MLKLIAIEVEDIENPGCNNGNYPGYTVTFDDGTTYEGTTCACGMGCSETDCIGYLRVGSTFENMDEFIESIRNE